jgi:hypothetical protein
MCKSLWCDGVVWGLGDEFIVLASGASASAPSTSTSTTITPEANSNASAPCGCAANPNARAPSSCGISAAGAERGCTATSHACAPCSSTPITQRRSTGSPPVPCPLGAHACGPICQCATPAAGMHLPIHPWVCYSWLCQLTAISQKMTRSN